MNATLKLVTVALVLFGVTLPMHAQQPTTPSQQPTPSTTFTAERLEQMAAPIALYPDALVAQILMASTYPLEIVEAGRWVEKNPGLTGQALEEALKQQEWDPSVKALCGFPTVLKQMNDNIEWTRDLGDAFLADKARLMDTIQTMRKKAFDAGSLKTTEQQRVAQAGNSIIIEPADPEVIYVPSYSPVVVYGPSWYYPTWYYPGWYYPPPFGYGFVSFGFGFFWGFGLWGHCDWDDHDLDCDNDGFNKFNTRTNGNPGNSNLGNKAGARVRWQHDPAHRVGVSYRNTEVAQRFGATPGSNRVTRDQARGIERSSTARSEPPTDSAPGTRALSRSPEPGGRSASGASDRDQTARQLAAGPAASRMLSDRGRDIATSASALGGRVSEFGPVARVTSPLPGVAGRSWSAPTYRGGQRPISSISPGSRNFGFQGGGRSVFQSPSPGRSWGGSGGMSRVGGSFGGGGSRGGGGSFGGGGRGSRGGGGRGHR